ncbi:rhodanese-like domain-containing protein, partial [Acinetobacter baumannii]
MPQTITTGYKALLADAEREIETLSVEQAKALYGQDGVVFVDLRDPRELEREGKVPGAFHGPRGMLEFW